MSLPLLATKLNVPPAGAKIVRRPRLFRLLDGSLDENTRLVLVCAPAGYGKTTLVSEWLQTAAGLQPSRFAWLALEAGDDDLTRFVTYFIAALQRIHPSLGVGVLKMLRTHKPAPVAHLVTLLVNELCEIQEPFFLTLDDYHLVTSESIQSFISFLVEHQPPHMRLVLITRTDPTLPLARLRARRQLVEMRQSDLAFLPNEVAEFTSQVSGLDLSSVQVGLLARQTEGWISGLQLATISMRNSPDLDAFLQAFSGEHSFIADYLTEEVLARLPDQLRAFLLKTSILERLSDPLCRAVTGQAGAQAMIEQLVAANLFIVPMDAQNEWYRYHILFATLLNKRLLSTQPEIVPELHERASRWFEENGLVDLAIEHAIQGKAYERANRMIAEVSENMLMHGLASTVLRWLQLLPEEEVVARPLLGSLYGFALIICGRPSRQVAALLEKMEECWQVGEYQGELNMLQAWVSILQGDARRAIHHSTEALQLLPAERSFLRSLAAETLGMGNTLAGDIPAATHAFEQVVEISLQVDNVMGTVMALTNLAGLQYLHGHFRSANATCQQVLELVHARIGSPLPALGKVLLNLGEIAREGGDLDAALNYFMEAARLMEALSELGPSIAYLSLARLMFNRKDWAAAQGYLHQARLSAQATLTTQVDDELVEITQASLWVQHGDLVLAIQWAQELGLFDRSPADLFASGNTLFNELFQARILVLTRLYVAQGQSPQAVELVDHLIEANRQRGYLRREVEFLVLKALALQQMNALDPALETLAQALPIGEAEGYFLTFVQEGEPMARLLYAAVQRKVCPAYASRLLNSIAANLIHPAEQPIQGDELIEPLSERELEVLRAIAQGFSNAEIAHRLYISLSTVKGHTTHIFEKLGVKNRTEAVARARSLGLLGGD